MLFGNRKMFLHQAGFSLVEILVGLVIGMLATLVIMQVFAAYEGQKRTTMGSADAQTNGSIALFTIQREAQMAGFGLSVFDTVNSPLRCTTSPLDVDHDGNGATPNIGMFPLIITDGGAGAGASDSIRIRYSTDGASAKSGIAVKITGIASPDVGVDNNLGCNNGDVVMISKGASCVMTRVNDNNLAVDTTHIGLASTAGVTISASLACMGAWNQFEYSVVNGQLQRHDASKVDAAPIVSDIVNIQAQYGVSAIANSNQVTSWVDASGAVWGPAITVADRNRIKAIRVAVVARNGLMEKDNVTFTCSSLTAAAPTGLCAWAGTAGSPAPAIDLSNDANWQRYRYRVYETIIPLRNMVWSRSTL